MPLPAALPESGSQEALLAAVQAQPAGAVTVTEPFPDAAPALALVGLIVYGQAAAMAVGSLAAAVAEPPPETLA